jgi:hypothetical protein
MKKNSLIPEDHDYSKKLAKLRSISNKELGEMGYSDKVKLLESSDNPESIHSFLFQYPMDIITAVERLARFQADDKLEEVISNFMISGDLNESSGVDLDAGELKSELLSGIVGSMMARAAGLAKAAPEAKSRIYSCLVLAISKVPDMDLDLEKKRKNMEERSKEEDKKRKKEEDEKERRQKEKEEEKRRAQEAAVGLEDKSAGMANLISSLFTTFMVSPKIARAKDHASFPMPMGQGVDSLISSALSSFNRTKRKDAELSMSLGDIA